MICHSIHPLNPQRHILDKAVHTLRNNDGICVYPTDTVYGMGACASNPKAIDRIARILQKDKVRLFSFLFADFSQISTYAQLSNQNFRLLKHHLPGPFTFILPATHFVPKKICPKRKTVGIRIPDNIICRDLITLLNEPLANTSISMPGGDRGDPDLVKEAVMHEVDLMLDCGPLADPIASTIVDLTGDEPVIVREGKGIFEG